MKFQLEVANNKLNDYEELKVDFRKSAAQLVSANKKIKVLKKSVNFMNAKCMELEKKLESNSKKGNFERQLIKKISEIKLKEAQIQKLIKENMKLQMKNERQLLSKDALVYEIDKLKQRNLKLRLKSELKKCNKINNTKLDREIENILSENENETNVESILGELTQRNHQVRSDYLEDSEFSANSSYFERGNRSNNSNLLPQYIKKAIKIQNQEFEKDLQQFYLEKLQKNNNELIRENGDLQAQVANYKVSEAIQKDVMCSEIKKKKAKIKSLTKKVVALESCIDGLTGGKDKYNQIMEGLR